MIRIEVDQRTELRQLQHRDAAKVAAVVLENYDHLYEWMPWVNENYSVDVTAQFISDTENQFKAGTSLQMVISRDEDLAGIVGFNVIDSADDCGEIGYWLSEKYEGMGLMSKCCRALIDYGFGEYCFNRIMIRCATENTRSQAIPERLGFTPEGILREAQKLHGKYVDLKVFSLLKSECEDT